MAASRHSQHRGEEPAGAGTPAPVAAKAAAINAAQAHPPIWKTVVKRALVLAVAVLDRKWRQAVLLTAGRLGFDLGCLLAALRATGADPRPSLVLLAYAAANIVALLPFTPGGLGLVEASLSGLLILAGVRPGSAFLATLAYRVASYWLPLLAGPPAYLLYRHRYERPAARRAMPGRGGLQHIARVYVTRARAAFPTRGLVGSTGQLLDDTGYGSSFRRPPKRRQAARPGRPGPPPSRGPSPGNGAP